MAYGEQPEFYKPFNAFFEPICDALAVKQILALLAIVPATILISGCTYADRDDLSPEELQARPSASAIDFGSNDSEFANDSECDDPRFEGPGMTETYLIGDDNRTDATDCREAYERGELMLSD